MPPLGKAHAREGRRAAPGEHEDGPEAEQHERQHDGRPGRPRLAEAPERQAPALPECEERDQDEGAARDAVGREHVRRF